MYQKCITIPSALLLRLFWFLVLCVPICKSAAPDSSTGCHLKMKKYLLEGKYYKKGDITIGGIFSVHTEVTPITITEFHDKELLCIGIDIREYHQLQAFIFAIAEINKNPDILPNVTLGFHVFNSCGHVQKVIKDVLQIISGPSMEAPNYESIEDGKVAGFIGDLYSITTLPMAQLLNFYGFTQISYGARDPLLSDRIQYPNFFRTVQNDQMQHVAIAKLLRSFGWNWVGIITSYDDAGDREMEHLSKQFNKYGICVEFKIKLSEKLHYNIPLELETSSSEILIICGTYYSFFVNFFNRVADVLQNKTLILPASWSHTRDQMHTDLKQLFDCGLFFIPPRRYFPALKEHLYRLHPSTHPTDMLLEDLWMCCFGCFLRDSHKKSFYSDILHLNLRNCTGRETFAQLTNFSGDPTTYHVYIAVLSMAQALHDVNTNLHLYGEMYGLKIIYI